MLNNLDQVITALEETFANGSEELQKGIGAAHGTLVKVKLPDGSLRVIKDITVENFTGKLHDQEVIITLA